MQGLSVQRKCGPYNLIKELARKYSHSTFLASPMNEPERQVILLVFAASLFSSPDECENLLWKAQCVKAVQHPHLAAILDMGVEEGQPFVVREYLPNESLRSRLKKISPRHLKLREALTVVSQVGEALAYAHEHNLVHGNIKPENILFDAKKRVLVADFNLVSRNDVILRDQTAEEYAFCYMAPEQFADTCDARSDQYALGCLAYELITGHVPFAAQSLASIMGYRPSSQPALLSEKVAGLPPSLESAVLKALAKDPAERFFDFSLFLEVLQSAMSSPSAFPFARSLPSDNERTISRPMSSAKPEELISPIRKRAAKRGAALEPSEVSGDLSNAEHDMPEMVIEPSLSDISLPEWTGILPLSESLASALQSQQSTLPLSEDESPLDNEERSDLHQPLQQQQESSALMLQSESPSSQLNMAATISERSLDDVLPAHLFMQEEEDNVALGASGTSVDREREYAAREMTTALMSTPKRGGPLIEHRQQRRRRVLKLILLLSVIGAVLSSPLWLSRILMPDTSLHQSKSPTNLRKAHLPVIPGLVLVPAQNPSPAVTLTPTPTPSPTPIPTPDLTATAIAANADPYSPYSGTLALSDPLSDNSRGYGWREYSGSSGDSCQFRGGAYRAISSSQDYGYCYETLRASDLTLEVQMQVIKGNCSGLMFRETVEGEDIYFFDICQTGSSAGHYSFSYWHGLNGVYLKSGSSAAVRTGSGVSNLLAVVARGGHFDLYVNHQQVDSADDSTYSQGVFGFCTSGLSSEAAYTNARMWIL